MTHAKKFVAAAFLALVLLIGLSLSAFGVSADTGYTAHFDTCGETSPFAAVRLTVQTDPLYKNTNDWFVSGEPSSRVALEMALSVTDWSKATEMRIRFKSNALPNSPSTAHDNNMAIGFVGRAADGKLYRKINKPYSSLRFMTQSETVAAQLYYINDQIPFFSMGRQMNCYIQAPLAEGSFGWYGEAENNVVALGNDAVGEISGEVRFATILLEPQNYGGMCLDIGDVEVKVGGVWQKAFDASKAELITKAADKTWAQTLEGMTANQCILEPFVEQCTTECCRVELIEATPCETHADANGDGYCDRCFAAVPHMFIDVLPIGNKDGLCDTCRLAVCGEGKCVDANGDGGCDVCGHTDYVEQPEPEPGSEPGTDGADDGSNGNQSETTDDGGEGGCGGAIAIGAGSLVLAGVTVLAAVAMLRKKRKE